jgi:hypothetical protein
MSHSYVFAKREDGVNMTFKCTARLSACVWLITVSLCLYRPAVAAQERPAKDQFVRLTVMPESLGAVYTEGLDPAVLQWVYAGEPMTIELVLWNNTVAQVALDRTGGDWFDLVQLNLVPRESATGPSPSESGRDRKLSARLIGQQRIGQTALSPRQLQLEAGSYERVRVRVDEKEVAALSPGIYVLRAALDSSALPAASRGRLSILQDERLIGIRALETRTDYLNFYAHMAIWAKETKDFGAVMA